MLRKSVIFISIFVSIILSGCVSQQSSRVAIHSGSSTYYLDVEIADEPEEWRHGLMNREFLDKDKGMLFVFPDSSERTFWMKNTLIPLDIIFISPSFSIVDITTMQPCKADPCPYYKSKDRAKYVLEVNAGFTKEKNITIGDSVSIYFYGNI